MKDKLIIWLGGYTKEEVKGFKKSIKKLIKELPTNKRLKEEEKELLHNFRTDAVFIQAYSKLGLEREVK